MHGGGHDCGPIENSTGTPIRYQAKCGSRCLGRGTPYYRRLDQVGRLSDRGSPRTKQNLRVPAQHRGAGLAGDRGGQGQPLDQKATIATRSLGWNRCYDAEQLTFSHGTQQVERCGCQKMLYGTTQLEAGSCGTPLRLILQATTRSRFGGTPMHWWWYCPLVSVGLLRGVPASALSGVVQPVKPSGEERGIGHPMGTSSVARA